MTRDLIGIIGLLVVGVALTWVQASWFKYDPDNDF